MSPEPAKRAGPASINTIILIRSPHLYGALAVGVQLLVSVVGGRESRIPLSARVPTHLYLTDIRKYYNRTKVIHDKLHSIKSASMRRYYLHPHFCNATVCRISGQDDETNCLANCVYYRDHNHLNDHGYSVFMGDLIDRIFK